MYRIDVQSASPALPVPAAAGPAGFFTDGDVVAGTPATVLPADFMNMLMLEVYNVVLAAGIAPSKTTYTQLRDAILNLATGQFTQSIAATGWQKLPSGLIIQWGQVTLAAGQNGRSPVTFPLTFPSACLNAVAANGTDTGVSSAWAGVGNRATNGMIVNHAVSSGTPAGTGTTAFWQAIGN